MNVLKSWICCKYLFDLFSSMNNPDATFEYWMLMFSYLDTFKAGTVKLGIKELFDKEQNGIKEPFPVTNLTFTS